MLSPFLVNFTFIVMIIATVTGRVGKDAETREHEGRKFVAFNIASNENTKNGEKKTTWVRVVSAQTALAEFLKKGKLVSVTGRLSFSVYNNEPQVNCRASEIELH